MTLYYILNKDLGYILSEKTQCNQPVGELFLLLAIRKGLLIFDNYREAEESAEEVAMHTDSLTLVCTMLID